MHADTRRHEHCAHPVRPKAPAGRTGPVRHSTNCGPTCVRPTPESWWRCWRSSPAIRRWSTGSRPRSPTCPTRRNRPASPIPRPPSELVDAVVAALGSARAAPTRSPPTIRNSSPGSRPVALGRNGRRRAPPTAAGAGRLSAVAARPAAHRQIPDDFHVAIIGAGIAGITAALARRRRRYRLTRSSTATTRWAAPGTPPPTRASAWIPRRRTTRCRVR